MDDIGTKIISIFVMGVGAISFLFSLLINFPENLLPGMIALRIFSVIWIIAGLGGIFLKNK